MKFIVIFNALDLYWRHKENISIDNNAYGGELQRRCFFWNFTFWYVLCGVIYALANEEHFQLELSPEVVWGLTELEALV